MNKDKPEAAEDPRGMSKDDAAIHSEARLRFDEIMGMNRQERDLCSDDRRFVVVHGAQWEGDDEEQYKNKARIEMNKTRLAIVKIKSAHRENPITCDFVSRDGRETDALATVCDGLFRSDEQDSDAQEAYDTGFEEAISGGFGAYRLRTAWEDPFDEDDDRQRIEFEPIYDADQRVFFDPNAKRQSKRDGMYAFVLTPYSREAYEAKFDDYPSDWPKEYLRTTHYDWVTGTQVWVAEYYRVEEESFVVCWYEDVSGEETKYEEALITDEMRTEFEAIGTKKTRTKTVKRRKVKKYTLSGSKVLIPKGERIAGPNIPVVPCYGERVVVDNVERCLGHVRLAKDPQRLKNMMVSRLAELASKSTIQKPIFYPEQVAGLDKEWSEDVVEDFPYLRINMVKDDEGNVIQTGPVAYTKPPDIPPGLAALMQSVDADLTEILGEPDGGDQVRSNVSSEAIERIHSRLDMQSFIYISNMAKSVQRGGEIWLGMAPEVYTEDGRTMKSVTPEGETTSVTINRPVVGKAGEIKSDTDLSKAKFNVYTNVAPASSSRKASTVRNLTNMMKAGNGGDPESVVVMQLMALMNSEGEGMQHLRDYASMRLVRMGIVDPSDEQAEKIKEEKEDAANQPPSEAEALMKAEAEKSRAQADEAIAKAESAKANQRKAVADAKKTEAETIGKLADMHPNDRAEALEIYGQMLALSGQQQPEAEPAPIEPQQQPLQQNAFVT